MDADRQGVGKEGGGRGRRQAVEVPTRKKPQ